MEAIFALLFILSLGGLTICALWTILREAIQDFEYGRTGDGVFNLVLFVAIISLIGLFATSLTHN